MLVKGATGNIFQWKLNWNSVIFIQENAIESVVCQNGGHFVQGEMSYITDSLWCHMVLWNWVNVGSGNGLLPDGTKSAWITIIPDLNFAKYGLLNDMLWLEFTYFSLNSSVTNGPPKPPYWYLLQSCLRPRVRQLLPSVSKDDSLCLYQN